jgi:hypothetical protein
MIVEFQWLSIRVLDSIEYVDATSDMLMVVVEEFRDEPWKRMRGRGIRRISISSFRRASLPLASVTNSPLLYVVSYHRRFIHAQPPYRYHDALSMEEIYS